MKNGSLDSLKVSVLCGCKPKACQIRTMADCDRPVRWAMLRVLQWVALSGLLSRVRRMTSSILASLSERGAPGRGSSAKPSKRSSTKRVRHLPTVCGVIRRVLATVLLSVPWAQAKMMRARRARRWADIGRLAHDCNWVRSSSVRIKGVLGRPSVMVFLLVFAELGKDTMTNPEAQD